MENKAYRESLVWKTLLNIACLLLAVVFIFSGFVKAVDPLGTFYKINDYAVAFGWGGVFPKSLLLLLSIVLCSLEFVIGVMLLFRVRERISSLLALLFMAFMTPLTLYLALTSPISDCGCFGDALILTNWQTFFKNVVLLAAAIFVYIGKDGLERIVSSLKDWMISSWASVFALGICMYSLYYIPMIDFRPYKIGVNIPEAMSFPEDAEASVFDTRFLMEKDGEKKEFTLDNYPDSTWTFVETRTILVKQGYEPPIHDFSLMNMETGEDETDEVLSRSGYSFMMVTHRVGDADESNVDLINEIYDYSMRYGYDFFAVTSSPEKDIEVWKEETGAEYPFYMSDDIALKTIVRSNPGLLLLKDGTILNKWSVNNLPDEFELTDALDKIALGKQKVVNNGWTVFVLFLIFVTPLMLIVGHDVWKKFRKKKKVMDE